MILQSKATDLGPVSLPEFRGERVYTRACGRVLPKELSRWQ